MSVPLNHLSNMAKTPTFSIVNNLPQLFCYLEVTKETNQENYCSNINNNINVGHGIEWENFFTPKNDQRDFVSILINRIQH